MKLIKKEYEKNGFKKEKEKTEKNKMKTGRKLSFNSNQTNESTKQSFNTQNTSCTTNKEKDVSQEIKNKFDEDNLITDNNESNNKIEHTNKYLENTEVLKVNIKISENKIVTFKIKRYDDLFYTISLFCEIYSIDEKFELPVQEFKFNELLEKAKLTRPELLAAEKKAEASKILIKASRVAFLPDIGIFGSYTSGGAKMTDTYSFQFGGGLQYQATNLYLLKKQVDEAKATYKRDAAELEGDRRPLAHDQGDGVIGGDPQIRREVDGSGEAGQHDTGDHA